MAAVAEGKEGSDLIWSATSSIWTATMGSGGSGVAEQTSEAEGRSTRGSPRVDGVTTLLLLFCCGSNQFDPVANSRCGSASQVGRPEPFAGL
jgi:hypothetical protein